MHQNLTGDVPVRSYKKSAVWVLKNEYLSRRFPVRSYRNITLWDVNASRLYQSINILETSHFFDICRFFKVEWIICVVELWTIAKYGKNLGRNVSKILFNGIIYVYYLSPGNELLKKFLAKEILKGVNKNAFHLCYIYNIQEVNYFLHWMRNIDLWSFFPGESSENCANQNFQV